MEEESGPTRIRDQVGQSIGTGGPGHKKAGQEGPQQYAGILPGMKDELEGLGHATLRLGWKAQN